MAMHPVIPPLVAKYESSRFRRPTAQARRPHHVETACIPRRDLHPPVRNLHHPPRHRPFSDGSVGRSPISCALTSTSIAHSILSNSSTALCHLPIGITNS